MTAGLRQQIGGGVTRIPEASLPLPFTTSCGVCQAGPVWTPDPWGRNKPDCA